MSMRAGLGEKGLSEEEVYHSVARRRIVHRPHIKGGQRLREKRLVHASCYHVSQPICEHWLGIVPVLVGLPHNHGESVD